MKYAVTIYIVDFPLNGKENGEIEEIEKSPETQ